MPSGASALPPRGIGLGIFVITGAIVDLVERSGVARVPFRTALHRTRGLPRSVWGTAFAHAGLGIALLGIVCETTWNSELISTLRPGDVRNLAGYEIKFDGMTQRQGPNFTEVVSTFIISEDGRQLSVMTPSKRSFATRGMSTTEAALMTRGVSQLYVSLGDTTADGGLAVRIYHKPLVLLIWFGPVLMAFGGLLSLSDRRLRVGAPRPARAARALQPAE